MSDNPTSRALATQDNTPMGMLDKYKGDFATVLPTHVRPEQWLRVGQGVVRRNQALAQAATRNPASFLAAMLDCARLGLEPGDTYHLVPFGGEVVGIVDYTGEIELIYRSGAVSSVKAEVVYKNDPFRFSPSMDRPDHNPDYFGEDRGEMVGAYAYAVMKDGATSRVVVMNKAEITKVMNVSKTASRSDSPWKLWPDRMWLKTVCHQLRKWVPSSAEYRVAAMASTAAIESVSPALTAIEPAKDYHEDDEITEGVIVPNDDDAPASAIADDGPEPEAMADTFEIAHSKALIQARKIAKDMGLEPPTELSQVKGTAIAAPLKGWFMAQAPQPTATQETNEPVDAEIVDDEPTDKITDHTRKRLFAMAGEAWPGGNDADGKAKMLGLAAYCDAPDLTSRTQITETLAQTMIDVLDAMKSGGQELYHRASGEWALRKRPAKSDPADGDEPF